LVFHESWKLQILPISPIFTARALDFLRLANHLNNIITLVILINYSRNLVHAHFTKDLGAMVAHFGRKPDDAEADGADAIFDQLPLC